MNDIDKQKLKEYEKRKKKYKGKEIDNSSLYAGSPMYYYCRYCSISTDRLREDDFSSVPREICTDCKELKNKDLI